VPFESQVDERKLKPSIAAICTHPTPKFVGARAHAGPSGRLWRKMADLFLDSAGPVILGERRWRRQGLSGHQNSTLFTRDVHRRVDHDCYALFDPSQTAQGAVYSNNITASHSTGAQTMFNVASRMRFRTGCCVRIRQPSCRKVAHFRASIS
jgi:hypothetical protein